MIVDYEFKFNYKSQMLMGQGISAITWMSENALVYEHALS
jgi:hypothetical protein